MRRVRLLMMLLLASAILLAVVRVVPGSVVSSHKQPTPVEMVQIAPRLTISSAMTLPQRGILYQRGPAIAYGEGVYLIVWQEGYGGMGGSSDILGMRLDEEGQWLDEKPIAICKDKAVQDTPAVAYCAGEFLVAWSDFRGGRDYDVYATLVEPSGRVKTPNGFLLSGGKGGRACPAIASNGKDRFLVVWQDHRGGKHFDIYGARVASDSGKVQDEEGILVLSPGERPALSYTGENYLVSLGQYGCLVGEDGQPSEKMTLWSGRRALPATVASAWGKGFAFFNTSPRPDPWGWGSNGAIIGISVAADGTSPEYGSTQHGWYNLARNQADRIVKNTVDASRWRNHNGWPMGMPGGFKGSHDGTWVSGEVAAAYNGRSLLVAWNCANFVDKLRIGNRDLYLKRILDNWAYVDEPKLKIVAGPTEEVFPAVAAGAIGNIILAYEKQELEGGIAIEYRLIHEQEDRQPPRIAHILKESAEKMSVVFDEPVERVSASKMENYAIEGIRVRSVTFNEASPTFQREVILETEPQKTGETYVLKITGVKDRSNNRNATKGEPVRYLCKPGKSQRSDFIERWAVLGQFPSNLKVEYIKPRKSHPSPGDEVESPSSDEIKKALKAIISEEDWVEGKWDAEADKHFLGAKRWQAVTCDAACVLNVAKRHGQTPRASVYAHTYVFSEKAQDVIVRLDTNDGHRAWLNGKVISTDDVNVRSKGRGIHDYTNEVPGKLKRGWNQLLVRVQNRFGHWMMVAQMTDRDRQPLRDLTYQLKIPFE